MMKKLASLLLALSLLFGFAACGDKNPPDTGTLTSSGSEQPSSGSEQPSSGSEQPSSGSEQPPEATTKQPDALPKGSLDTGMREKLSPVEYSAYVDLFYNKNAAAYEGKQYTKDGVFAVLKDAYNEKDRYYVWGYADKTKCCDYQWEFVMPGGTKIPEPGSYIKVTGKMTKSDDALDGYWLTDAKLEIQNEFKHAGFDMDMTTMSSTLARVEVINMVNRPDGFVGKTVRVFGRALGPNTIQHPYYDEAWQMDFTDLKSGTQVATGQYILLEGKFTAEAAASADGGETTAQERRICKIETSKISVID